MYSIYLDFITLTWATIILIAMPTVVWRDRSIEAWLALLAVALYLTAQTGWTTAYFSGHIFGAIISNYIWFFFNATVLLLFTLNLRKR
jgi:hypothetical protein